MFQMLAIIISIGSIGWAFYSPIWAWSPLICFIAFLLFMLFGVKKKKWRYVDTLSPDANQMLQRFGHYYAMPFAGRDFSGAASTIQFAGVAVGIVGALNNFYWGLGAAVVGWLSLGAIAVAFNPSNFIRGTDLEAAHNEVIAWMMDQSQQQQKKCA